MLFDLLEFPVEIILLTFSLSRSCKLLFKRRRNFVIGQTLHYPSLTGRQPGEGGESDDIEQALSPRTTDALRLLGASQVTIEAIEQALRRANILTDNLISRIRQPDADSLLPGSRNVGARLLLVALAKELRPGPLLPDLTSSTGGAISAAFDMSTALHSRGLVGLDPQLLPSSTILDTLLRGKSNICVILLESPMHHFIDMHDRPTLASISTRADKPKTNDLQTNYLRLGEFSAALMCWSCTAALLTDIKYSSIFNHVAACLRYADIYGSLTAQAYDKARRRGAAMQLRAGSSADGPVLLRADGTLASECRNSIDHALAQRSTTKTTAPRDGSRLAQPKAGSFRSFPYSH
ncbi:hypothetical protein FOL47_009024 [Perkinsus chesapeaki]|uniref:Uncharacterized protein n=1 Tax=Perkinsus chesapeaki TaxID=330153 RepID=A0A7J6LAT3_PERCH|nr:hypothetical protein FOL47_009024 [Perkinsus chesapeaki]